MEAQTPCPSCAHRQAVLICNVDGKTGEPLRTIMCKGCGLGRIDPLPERSTLEAWYRDAYRQEYKSNIQPKMRHILRAARNARDRWVWLKSQALLPEGARRTLDVGSSSGEFVFLMNLLGFDTTGIEPHAGYASYAQNQLDLNILHGPLLDQAERFAASSLHLITLFHVLEHLVSPLETLMTLRRLLRRDGLLYIEVPGSTRLCGHATLFFKAHALHFTGPTLKAIVERAGFDVLTLDAPWDGNIRLLARPSQRQYFSEVVSSKMFDDSMRRAAQMRTPLRYAWQQIMTAAPIHKLARNIEERQYAKNFSSPKECLTHVYSDLQ